MWYVCVLFIYIITTHSIILWYLSLLSSPIMEASLSLTTTPFTTSAHSHSTLYINLPLTTQIDSYTPQLITIYVHTHLKYLIPTSSASVPTPSVSHMSSSRNKSSTHIRTYIHIFTHTHSPLTHARTRVTIFYVLGSAREALLCVYIVFSNVS